MSAHVHFSSLDQDGPVFQHHAEYREVQLFQLLGLVVETLADQYQVEVAHLQSIETMHT